MRIVIDMQGAQTESRFRGIGRYSMAFARSVVRNRGKHEIVLALSGLFPETVEPIRAAFDGLLPQENIRVWHAPGPVKEEQPGNESRREVAQLLREAFLASLQPDVIHISSLFEGYDDDAVTSVCHFDQKTPISVILYDLIPLQNPEQYFESNPRYEAYYRRKLKSLNAAGFYLAISEFSRQEAIDVLGISDGQVVNISTAIDEQFHQQNISADTAAQLKKKFGIYGHFVLYTGGADERKNLPRLIEAYAALPDNLRHSHQLLFAGRMPEGSIDTLKQIASKAGLKEDELCFTGYVSDEELIQIYNLCNLYVFPSWHEGFGLPALEAMACGAAVIGSNTTSLPEVIGLPEALFDPMDTNAISQKMAQALADDGFHSQLCEHGRKQKELFNWDYTAQRAITAWEHYAAENFISKPESSAIKAQHRNLINAIAPHLYDTNEHALLSLCSFISQNQCAGIEHQLLLDISELHQHDSATGVQRVVRSYLHQLLRNPPRGFRVLPVYATLTQGYQYATAYTARFLGLPQPDMVDVPIRWQRGDIFFGLDMQHHVQLAHASTFARLRQGGVVVKFLVYDLLPVQLADFFKDDNAKALHEQWLSMIAVQDEAICISKATADAYEAWIRTNGISTAPGFATDWVHMGADLAGSQPSRGVPSNALHTLRLLESRPSFLAVSTLEPRKAQSQILDAVEALWSAGEDINLVLVGQQGWKIDALVDRIAKHPENGKRLFWLKGISDEYLERVYQVSTCLVAASINEGFGLPLIEAARHALPVIARDIPVFREVAGEAAFYFSGDTGEQLALAIVKWLRLYREGVVPQSTSMRWSTWEQSTEQLKVALFDRSYPRRQLLVDISELVQRDARTGIQRVVRSVLKEWLLHPPDGYRVEPVYATVEQGYRYAKVFTGNFIGQEMISPQDELIEFSPGDVFFGLDLNHHVPRVHQKYLQGMHRNGVDVRFLVYDLLPIQFPEFWETQHSVPLVHSEWLSVITSLGGAVCISKAVADELAVWVKQNGPKNNRTFLIDWFHLGADVDHAEPTLGLPQEAESMLAMYRTRPTFLMVGTLEPRKGHEQVLDAFECLWQSGTDANLVIVGKQGWMVESLVDRLRAHQELGKRLFWLEGISDDYLKKIYATSTCLMAASYGEGFGLPLIEAAQHKLPIIARDIPVFHEVAADHAFYFDANEPEQLAQSIEQWLDLYATKKHPRSDGMPWLKWKQSAGQLLKALGIQVQPVIQQ